MALKKIQDLYILVVDDMPNMRRTIKNMLQRMGVKKPITEADDGDRAWEKIQSNPIDFVICDWNMVRMKGIELLQLIRSTPKYADIPFLMLTGEIEEKTVAQAAESEIDAYIIKPFVMKTLVEKVEEAMKRRFEPGEAELVYRRGMQLFKEGSLAEAFKAFQYVRELSPKTAKVYLALGDVYLEQKGTEKAKKMYEKAISLSRQYAMAMDRLAQICGMEGDLQRMAELLRSAVEISPQAPERQLEYGKALLATGNKEKAVHALETALKQAPNNPELAREAGEAFMAADMDDRASRAFQKALALNPNEVETYNRLGVALRKQKKYLEAIKEYQKALILDSKNEVILYNMAIAYYHHGLHREATDSLQRLVKINPQHMKAQQALNSMASGGGV